MKRRVARAEHPKRQRNQDDQPQRNEQIECGEERVLKRDALREAGGGEPVNNVRWQCALRAVERCHGERSGARKSAVPDHEAEIARRGDDGVVVGDVPTSKALANLASKQRADDESQSPVDDPCGARDKAHKRGASMARLRHACQSAEQAADRSGGGKHVSGHKDETHLHAEGQQRPHVRACGAGISE